MPAEFEPVTPEGSFVTLQNLYPGDVNLLNFFLGQLHTYGQVGYAIKESRDTSYTSPRSTVSGGVPYERCDMDIVVPLVGPDDTADYQSVSVVQRFQTAWNQFSLGYFGLITQKDYSDEEQGQIKADLAHEVLIGNGLLVEQQAPAAA